MQKGRRDTQASLVTYPPLDVLKPVADGVWIVDSGPLRVAGATLPVRMTVIRLANGDLFLHSPTRAAPELVSALEAIGRIRHLVAPNIAHWVYLGAWHERCPEAVTWAAPGLRARGAVRRAGLRLDRDLGDEPPPDWAADIDQVVMRGALGFSEVVFLHKATRTAVLTDLVVNLEPDKLPPRMRAVARLGGAVAPEGRAMAYLRWIVAARRAQSQPAAERIVAFAPERVIFAHGAWFDRGATPRLRRALDWLLP